ncbi:hypothetical protein AgCh_022316 [Apium graveolens]
MEFVSGFFMCTEMVGRKRIEMVKDIKRVMKTLVQHFDSCHFAYTNVTKCVSDKKMKFEHDNDKADSLFVHDPLQFAVYSRLKCFINYEDKCSKQLCREVLASELVRYDKDKKTSANIEGVQYENRVAGKENSMAGNEYLVSLEVLWTRDEVVSEQELERDFPLLEPIDLSGEVVVVAGGDRKWRLSVVDAYGWLN